MTKDPVQDLIHLIVMAETLTDEQKTLYLAEIEKGRLHPDLLRDLDALCDREEAIAKKEIVELTDAMAIQKELARKEEEAILPAAQRVAKEHDQELGTIVSNFKQEVSTIDRELYKGVESDKRGTEASEADAIRQALKKTDKDEE